MGRETKIGLLAGLAFIICFALILANRGQTGVGGLAQSTLMNGGSSGGGIESDEIAAPDSKGIEPDHRSGRRVAQRPVAAAPGTRSEREDRLASRGSNHDPSGPSKDPTASVSGGSSPNGVRQGAPPTADQTATALSAVTEPAGTPALYQPPRSLQEQQRVLREKLEEASRSTAGHGPSMWPDERRVSPPAGPVVGGANEGGSRREAVRSASTGGGGQPPETVEKRDSARYVVQSGDTLSKIAGRHYGLRSANVIRAIVDANRGVLSDPDSLEVGMELRLPAAEGLKAGGESDVPVSPRIEKKAASSSSKDATFRWYQVRRGDRYVTIARDQLGDAERWNEVFELNKDKFPDPDAIREGVRIKLPASPVADGAQRRP